MYSSSSGWVRLTVLSALVAAIVLPGGALAQRASGEPNLKPLKPAPQINSHVDSFTTPGGHTISYYGVEYDFQSPGESTWYYSITSGSSPNVSHSVFEIGSCADIEDAGTWDHPDKTDLDSGAGNPDAGFDPTTGVTGIKFDEGVAPGSTHYYYFTLDGNYAVDHVTAGVKAGSNEELGEINGPSLQCAEPTGTIKIEKDTGDFPNHGGDFRFDRSWGPDFFLETASGGPPKSRSFELSPGNYTVIEQAIPNVFDLVDINCSVDGNGGSAYDVNLGDAKVDFDLEAGDTIHCVYTNIKKRGYIQIIKQTDPAGSPQGFDFQVRNLNGPDPQYDGVDPDQDFFGVVDGQMVSTTGLRPYTEYSVKELVPNGWDLTGINCQAGNFPTPSGSEYDQFLDRQGPAIEQVADQVDIYLYPDQTVTCTFDNYQESGTIIVRKETVPDEPNNTTEFGFEGPGQAAYNLTDDGQESFTLPPGNYSVAESGIPSGWQLTGATCSDQSNPGDINLSAGETVICTFTNTQEGSITVVKQTIPAGSNEVFDFTGDLGSFQLTDGQSESQNVMPGDYSVSESVPSGWELTSATCDDGSDPASIDVAAGEAVTCTFENTQDGSITVVKQTLPAGSDEVFDFTGDLGSFQLSDGQSESQNVEPGNYSVSETVPSGWDLTSATCNDGSDPSSINLEAGEDVLCTFENTQEGSITVVKQTIPAGSDELFDFTGDLGSFQLSDGQSESGSFGPGNYSVSESVPEGWDLTSATCDDGSDPSSIGLEAGEDVTCTFENTQDGSITVVKQTIPAGSDEVFDFTGDLGGFQLSDGQSESQSVGPGTYGVSETVPEGWSLTSASCDDGSDPSSIDVAAGEDVTCTFENTQGGSITVVKQTIPAGSDEVFDFTGDLGGFQLSDGQSESQNFEPGTYGVSETVPEGWSLTSASCDDGSDPSTIELEAGEDVTCTFENTQDGSITVVKQTIPAGSNEVFDFTGDLGSFQLSDGQSESQNLEPGTYGVSETVPDGWSLTSATCDDGSDPSSIELAAGEEVTCTFENTQGSSITVVKQTIPSGSDEVFDFTGDLGSFQLSDGQSETQNVEPGTYGVSETVPEGWNLTSASCDDGSDPSTIELDAGENVTCTFENTQDGSITVVKETIPSGSNELFDFTGDLGSFQLSDGQFESGSFGPGNYSVSESVPEGWDLTSATCDDGSDPSSIGLEAGEDVTCTFENTQDGSITVVKETIPSGSDELFDFTGDLGSFQLSDGQSESGSFGPGNYSVSESVPEGWDLTSATCDDGSDPSSVSLEAGEDVTCTFENTQDGSITVVKQTIPSGSDEVFDFTGDLGGFQLSDGDSEIQSFSPGTYSVSESVPSGWELTSASCDDGSDPSSIELAAGEDVTCTFENTQLEASLSVVKKTNGDEIRDNFCDEGTIIVGEPVEWTYEVTNTGEQPLLVVSITDDSGTSGDQGDDFTPTFVSGDDGNDVLDPGETWIYSANGNAQEGEYANVVTVEAEVQGSGGEVTAKGGAGEIIESSDVSGYCGVQVDLSIEKTDGGQLLVPEGGTFAYTLTYENLGSVDVTGVTINETVPENTRFSAADSTDGWSCADGAEAGTACTFTVGALAAGESGSVEFGLEVLELVEPDPETGECPEDPPDFKVDNTASIVDDGENGEDSNPDNNQDSDDTPIATSCDPEQQTPSISIEKTPDLQKVQAGDPAEFTIRVTNDGPVDLINVIVSDPKAPDCDKAIGDLASGDMNIYNCKLSPVTESFTNIAKVTGETPEGGDVSDEDDADVTVLNLDEPEQQHHPIPTTSQWGLILMAGLMLMLGAVRAREWTRR